MTNKKMISIGLIVFGIMACVSLIAQGHDEKTATVTLSLTLGDTLSLNYVPGQLTLLPTMDDNSVYSSNPGKSEFFDKYPISISSRLPAWQLDVSMTNGGYLRSDDHQDTSNPVEIYLFNPGDPNEGTIVGASAWPSDDGSDGGAGDGSDGGSGDGSHGHHGHHSGEVSSPMAMDGSGKMYYTRYDIKTTSDDSSGIYTGEVVWTLTPAIVGTT